MGAQGPGGHGNPGYILNHHPNLGPSSPHVTEEEAEAQKRGGAGHGHTVGQSQTQSPA